MSQRQSAPVPCRSKHRSRKAHTKSKSGCSNCRFRRVKCDETKPHCKRCIDYMVPCSYATLDVADPPAAAGFTVIQFDDSLDMQMPKQQPLMYTGIPWAVKMNDQISTIVRFRERTVFSLGNNQMARRYSELIPRLAFEHEHLFHAVVAVTIIHDRALAKVPKPSQVESYHLGQSAALFNRKLSGLISDNDCAAIWATSVCLCSTACFAVNTTDPEEAFPLKRATAADLEWLQMQAGLKVVWTAVESHKLSNPLWLVDVQKTGDNCVFPLGPPPGIIGLPESLVKLCELTPNSNDDNNPYHTSVWHLSWMLKLDCHPSNILKFMVFAGGISPRFKALLRKRDPRALLLLALWYSKLITSAWWIATRAMVESEAIYRYLLRFHPLEHQIHELLESVRQSQSSEKSESSQQFVGDVDCFS